MKLNGKVVLITGGGTGIGETTARLCASQGAAVVITGRRQDVLDKVASDLNATGAQALAVAGSVTDEEHVKSAVDQTVRTFGHLDVLVNNAGGAREGYGLSLHETPMEVWESLLDVNLSGAFRFTRAAIPHMLTTGGSIVHISSIAGVVGMSGFAAYGAAKGGLIALSRALAVEYGPQKIRSNCICPGIVETPLTMEALSDPQVAKPYLAGYPVGRFGKMEEVANAVIYFASDDAGWITGTVLVMDGGFTAQ